MNNKTDRIASSRLKSGPRRRLANIVLLLSCLLTSMTCSFGTKEKIQEIENDKYILTAYRVHNPATVPNYVFVESIKKGADSDSVNYLLSVDRADSVFMQFIYQNIVKIEVYSIDKIFIDTVFVFDMDSLFGE